MSALQDSTIDSLRRKGLLLVWVGELWNLLEAAIGLWSGFEAGSISLIAFGLDSFIELFAGGVLIWHLSKEWDNQEASSADELRAHRLIGATFLLLSVFILAQSLATLTGVFPEPEESLVGIAIVTASAVIMFALYVSKTRVARKLNSPALRAEAVESLVCDVQDITLLIGLGLNALIGWWWADPIAALALIPLLIREGIEPFGDEGEEE